MAVKPGDEFTITNLSGETITVSPAAGSVVISLPEKLPAGWDLNVEPSHHVTCYQFEAFTPEQHEQRRVIIEELEAERRRYYARCEPLIQKLGKIQGKMHCVVNTAPR